MKKRIFAMLCILALLASACGKKQPAGSGSAPASSPAQSAPVSEPVQPAEPETHPAIVYLPDENAENLVAAEVEVPAGEDGLTAELAALVAALEEQGALPEGSALLGAEEGEPVALDMNEAFGDGMKSTGTTGETLYLGALVNTVLEYTGAKAVRLTVEGAPLETGHTIYDEPIGVVTP